MSSTPKRRPGNLRRSTIGVKGPAESIFRFHQFLQLQTIFRENGAHRTISFIYHTKFMLQPCNIPAVVFPILAGMLEFTAQKSYQRTSASGPISRRITADKRCSPPTESQCPLERSVRLPNGGF